jgi:hypothetical protein
VSNDPFLARLAQESRTAQAMADVAREQGDLALADQIERDEAERTIQALLAHGYQI